MIGIIGIFALMGFIAALLIHSRIRGDGSIISGLQIIYEKDVLRRTLGGNVADFDASYTDSLNASIISVVLKYFNFANSTYTTQIIAGIDGNLFPILALLSCILVAVKTYHKTMDMRIIGLYFWMFLSCISWFVFGKSHSAIHVFLNYIMWYFGYVQMMLYVLVKSCIDFIDKRGNKSDVR